MRKHRILLVGLALLLLLAPALASAATVTGPHTVTVWYDDEVQITYAVNFPGAAPWTGRGNIPIGGVGALTEQVFCIDPFAPFHERAESTWDSSRNAMRDTMAGYHIAAPWAAPTAIRQAEDAIEWLVRNGYRGDYRTHNVRSQQSLTRLSALYPGIGTIDQRIALMATQAAFWTLVTDEATILRTSLDLNPTQRQTFNQLVDGLVRDARAGRTTGPVVTNTTTFGLTLTVPSTGQFTTQGAYGFYGPLTIRATLQHMTTGTAAPVPALTGVYLSASGPNAANAIFTMGSGASATPLPTSGPIFGYPQPGQFIAGTTFGTPISNGVWELEGVYLRVPLDRTPANAESLAITARAEATNVGLVEGTPLLFAYEADYIQNFDHVQAFVGAAQPNTVARRYAETHIQTGGTVVGRVYVSNHVANVSPFDLETPFTFQLLSSASNSTNLADFTAVNLSAFPISGAFTVDPVTNTFTLRDGRTAVIEGLPTDLHYRVVASAFPEGFSNTPGFSIHSGGSHSHGTGTSTTTFQIGGTGTNRLATVAFTQHRTTPTAHIHVQNIALEPIGTAPTAHRFGFSIEISRNNGTSWEPLNLTDRFHSSGGAVISPASNGRFTLGARDVALIEVDVNPAYRYRVTEENPGQNWTPSFMLQQFRRTTTGFNLHHSSTDADSPNWNPNAGLFRTGNVTVQSGDQVYVNFLNTAASLHDLSLRKNIAGGSTAQYFDFQVTHRASGVDRLLHFTTDSSAVSGGTARITGVPADRIRNDSNGHPTILRLRHNDTAVIHGLSTAQYIIRELGTGGYIVTYTVGGGNSRPTANGTTGPIQVNGDTSVVFTNTLVTPTPTPTATPTPTVSPTATPTATPSPTATGSPQTSDDRPFAAYVILLIVGITIMGGAAVLYITQRQTY
ncbi:MAG: Cys-Gln thioester bond-forming surface protein [Oscillospiraceae bacterium]|nr:Cys-Gln thioester bond-forming surface protein [Oscillospiraceae bacterium]